MIKVVPTLSHSRHDFKQKGHQGSS